MASQQLPRMPGSPEQQYLAALVAGLAELNQLLREVLGRAEDPTLGGAVQRRLVSEPDPRPAPRMAQPVAEPNLGRGAPPPAAPPDDPADDAPADPPPRPKGNASTEEWRTYAEALGLTMPGGAGRSDIITAVGRHTAQQRRR